MDRIDYHGYLPREQLPELLLLLVQAEYQLLAAQEESGAMLYKPLAAGQPLPTAIGDEQGPGHYRLVERFDRRNFAWANGPQALKPMLFAPQEPLWRYQRDNTGELQFTSSEPQLEPTAVIGVRACDLAAMKIHDQHFLEQESPDLHYQRRRESLFIIAVDCSHPSASCFCVSTGDGPEVEHSYDLALTELEEGFLLRGGSVAGHALLSQLALEKVTDDQRYLAHQQHESAVARQQRALPKLDLQRRLFANLHHQHWQAVAERCLSCGNCTSVCPTCFCHREFDQGALDGSSGEHLREWESCFSEGHSYIHGLHVRSEPKFRYRQWLTHKLGSWHEQYGRSGCVGCGRCISWCPVGIDLTEEVEIICGEGSHD
ncbi:sulfite reductase subunit A [Solemya pervernicosa gill symbiont]|uniref:Sulfite reductase subunit A n=2 Tax=Gammaproteobacteria incertae sedis TaxID=118884 RepID=A0A1T2L572_9GAMM|nr:4Fe-4S dicluster domain-containing protein [Candidatus Reidiella endopervernicosa]OOZ40214.1 sulfite reductase subunit A [Solemya pervernicosa gill symbiont]QKQ27130.1 4Fe-4S dicluster domain-containing protein [Candidatus Reidiella endopervernicosa]